MKQRIKAALAGFCYDMHQRGTGKKEIRVASLDETLDELLTTRKSLVRFGDGEIIMIRGKDLAFQKASPELSRSLADILRYEDDGLMVAIPDVFSGLGQYRKSGQEFWKDHLLFFRSVYREYCSSDKRYGNAFVSRCYYNFENKSKCAGWFSKIMRLWQGEKTVVVEGAGTHNGVGNDLLGGAAEVERIICPSCDAYGKLEAIAAFCLAYPKDSLFLISLGPAAKPLTRTLYRAGYRVLDIGNLDMEYEWFLQGAETKVKLPKHGVMGMKANREAGYTEYLEQIKRVIE